MFKQSKGDHSGKAKDMTDRPSPLNMSLSFLPGINTLKLPSTHICYLHIMLNSASYHIKTIFKQTILCYFFQMLKCIKGLML